MAAESSTHAKSTTSHPSTPNSSSVKGLVAAAVVAGPFALVAASSSRLVRCRSLLRSAFKFASWDQFEKKTDMRMNVHMGVRDRSKNDRETSTGLTFLLVSPPTVMTKSTWVREDPTTLSAPCMYSNFCTSHKFTGVKRSIFMAAISVSDHDVVVDGVDGSGGGAEASGDDDDVSVADGSTPSSCVESAHA